MSYQPLARKYRPLTFHDLIGQDGVTLALENSVKLHRELHGIIFAGVRGVGKTTLARIYAKALNCDEGPTAKPCGHCESCRAIEMGVHEDVLEIDGASNTGVDDVRALRETVEYVPQRSKFKVYIIDEVHMLSQSAFNALLKTLEEPPQHVVFVFATTELNKIPQTIVSRCQTFHLQRLSLAAIKSRLQSILEQENVSYEEKALALVAAEGHGSMRDALTFLDQAIALGGGRVTETALSSVIQHVSSFTLIELIGCLLKRDKQGALKLISQIDQQGLEYTSICEQLAKVCRHAFIVRDLGSEALDISLLGLDDQELQHLASVAQTAEILDLNRLFRTLVKCLSDLDGSALDRYVLENYLLEWCLDPGLPDLDEWAIRKEAVSEKEVNKPRSRSIEGGTRHEKRRSGFQAKKFLEEIKQRSSAQDSKVVEALVSDSKASEQQQRTFPDSWRELVDLWKKQKPLQARILEEAYLVKYSSEEIVVSVNPNSLAAGKLLQSQIQTKVEQAFQALFGFTGRFRAVVRSEEPKNNEAEPKKESILEVKQREKAEQRKILEDKLKSDEFTQKVVAAFDARIVDVKID